jgi:four helix bundle protein
MPNWTTLPHQNLIAYQVARELVVIVRAANIKDSKLRDQALRAATSACLNIAEAVGRVSAVDKARVYGIARGEGCEAVAAVDIAAAAGYCSAESVRAAMVAGLRLYALLTALSRRLTTAE